MNLRQLDTFLQVVELKGFRKAAQRLNTTQPAVSSRISNLESDLQVRLFDRCAGAISLTAKGQELLPYVEEVLTTCDKLREKAQDGSEISGLLRLGCSEAVVHTWLSDYIKRFHEKYPAIDLELKVDGVSQLCEKVTSRALDIAILPGPISSTNIANIGLCRYPVKWFCSHKLPFANNTVLSQKELLKYPILNYSPNGQTQSEFCNLFKQLGISQASTRVISSSSLSAVIRMLRDGVGIASLPTAVINRDIGIGDIIEVKLGWCPTDLQFTASYNQSPYNSFAHRAAKLALEVASSYEI